MTDFRDICETCTHFNGTQIWDHCCNIDIDTPLRYMGACEDYEYDPDCMENSFCRENKDYSYLKEGPKEKIILW